MWIVEANVINQNLRNIPFSSVNITFDQYESEFTTILPYSGREIVGPFIGQRWTPVQGWSQNTSMSMGCDYDGVHNDTTSLQINSDSIVTCMVEISNQPPFVIWDVLCLTHHEAPRMHKPHECHLEGSREHLGASCGPPGSHLGVLWELPAASWELYALESKDF